MNRVHCVRVLLLVFLFAFATGVNYNCYAQEKQNLDEDRVKKGYDRYVRSLFQNYDKDRDGELSQDEVDRMRRKPSREADADKDGKITEEELLNYYIEKRGKSRSRDGKSSKSDTQKQQGSSGLMGGMPAKANKKKTGGMADNVVGSQLPTETLATSIYMLRSGNESLINALETELKGVAQKDVEKVLHAMRVDPDIDCDIDQHKFSTTWNEKFEMNSGSRVPVVRGVNYGRSGSVSSEISEYSIGTKLDFLAADNKGKKYLSFDLQKSTVIPSAEVLFKNESGSKTYAKQFIEVDVNSSVPYKKNSASVVASSDSGSAWLFIVIVQ